MFDLKLSFSKSFDHSESDAADFITPPFDNATSYKISLLENVRVRGGGDPPQMRIVSTCFEIVK